MALSVWYGRSPALSAMRQWCPGAICRRCMSSELRPSTRQRDRIPSYAARDDHMSIFPTPRKNKTPHQYVNRNHHPLRHIKAFPSPPSTAKAHPIPIQDWVSTHLQTLDPSGARTRLFSRENADRPQPGDILLASFKTGDPFSGVCLSIRQRGLDTAILLRNRMLTTGVEMWIKVFSPNVKSVEVVQRAQKRARRARLYFMRKPKHDRGSVEGIVSEYLRKQRLIRSGSFKGNSSGIGHGAGKGKR